MGKQKKNEGKKTLTTTFELKHMTSYLYQNHLSVHFIHHRKHLEKKEIEVRINKEQRKGKYNSEGPPLRAEKNNGKMKRRKTLMIHRIRRRKMGLVTAPNGDIEEKKGSGDIEEEK
ncbi:hypothetical protein KY290_027329 [Solanum tuberosum]|uniref:Uncharacterized protein n=1 Tax=Solanum tuberosum TaxID=4113 RepID=A0ABQ7UET2_SOLTU|nr:hypothetical protein KY290_027329 [Solanum tuberosum]